MKGHVAYENVKNNEIDDYLQYRIFVLYFFE